MPSSDGITIMGVVTDQLFRLFYRAGFYLDVPALVQLLEFRQLRQRYYQELWQVAAGNIGARARPWDFGFCRIDRDGLSAIVRQSSVMLDDHLTLEVMGNKALVYELMREKGYATPRHRRYTMRSLGRAEAFLGDDIQGPVVVKPASGTGGGRGVTTGIVDRADLRKASRLAARFDTELLVEEQLEGRSYRLLYLDGVFIDAIRRDPPIVTGTGRHTIRQLVARENRRRLTASVATALSPLRIDPDCRNKLRQMGLKPSSKPQAGQVVELKRAVNENGSRGNHTVTDQVHPETIAAGARLVTGLGVRLAGLDVLCRDISVPLGDGNGLISEINTTPGLHHHDLVADRSKRVRVAERLLSHMFETRQGVMTLNQGAFEPIRKIA